MEIRNEWMGEFEFDPISAKRIADVTQKRPMSLAHCAEILECVAPFCEELTVEGFLRRLKALEDDLLHGNYTLRPAPGGKDVLVMRR